MTYRGSSNRGADELGCSLRLKTLSAGVPGNARIMAIFTGLNRVHLHSFGRFRDPLPKRFMAGIAPWSFAVTLGVDGHHPTHVAQLSTMGTAFSLSVNVTNFITVLPAFNPRLPTFDQLLLILYPLWIAGMNLVQFNLPAIYRVSTEGIPPPIFIVIGCRAS